MARSNTPCGLYVSHKNKYLHGLKAPPFHDAVRVFKKCCSAITQVWTSLRCFQIRLHCDTCRHCWMQLQRSGRFACTQACTMLFLAEPAAAPVYVCSTPLHVAPGFPQAGCAVQRTWRGTSNLYCCADDPAQTRTSARPRRILTSGLDELAVALDAHEDAGADEEREERGAAVGEEG